MEVPTPIAVVRGRAHECVFSNRAFDRLCASGEVVGRLLPEVLELGAAFAHALDRAATTRLPQVVRELLVGELKSTGKATRDFLTLTIQPLPSGEQAAGKEASELLITGIDVTDAVVARQKLENRMGEVKRERDRLFSLFNQAPLLLGFQRGADHVFELVNTAYQESFGPRELLGKPFRAAFPERMAEGIAELLDRVYTTGETFFGEHYPVHVERPDGSTDERYFNCIFQPLRDFDDQVEGVLTVGIDVTEVEYANRERARVQGERERLLGELQQAVKARDEFLSVASHELRTPLTTLRLVSSTLVRAVDRGLTEGLTPERLREKMASVQRQVERLTHLVNGLLDVSRITAGRLEFLFEPVDLAEVAREVGERFREELQRNGYELTIETPVPVVGQWDRLRLDQIVTNLLANAIKYGASQPILIRVTSVPAYGRLEVKDHGIGIAPEHQTRIFSKFERVSPQRHDSGLGLGLWITRHIVEGLGGTIRVSSEVKVGSEFVVELPLAGPQA